MSTVTLSRASGLTLLLGLAVFVIGSILSFASPPLAPLWLVSTGVWVSGMALLLLGLPGIVSRQVKDAGWLGFAGYLLAFLGWFLLTGFYIVDNLIMSPWLNGLAPHVYAQWFVNPAHAATIQVANLLLGAGALLLGTATIRARVLPRGSGVLLIAAAVANLGSFVNSNLTTVAVGLVALGLGWMGFALWSAPGEVFGWS